MNFHIVVATVFLLFCATCNQQARCEDDSSFEETPIGGECQEDYDCVALNKSECEVGSPRNICKCKAGFAPQSDNLDCLKLRKKVGFFESCTESQQCVVEGSECVRLRQASGSCLCRWDLIPHPNDPTKCIKKAFFGDPCNQHDEQCLDPEACQGLPGHRVCTCPPKHVPSRNRIQCLKEVTELGEPCVESAQCMAGVEHSECVGPTTRGAIKTCQCSAEFISPPGDKSRCSKKSLLVGGPCNEDDNPCAMEHASCSGPTGNKTCTCASSTHIPSEDGSTCLAKVELGKPCFEEAQCAAAVPFSECWWSWTRYSSCQCSIGFIAAQNSTTKCNLRAPFIGQPCAFDDNQCTLKGASCQVRNGFRSCECLDGYEEDPRGRSCKKNNNNKSRQQVSTVLVAALSASGTMVIGTLVVVGVRIYLRRRRYRRARSSAAHV